MSGVNNDKLNQSFKAASVTMAQKVMKMSEVKGTRSYLSTSARENTMPFVGDWEYVIPMFDAEDLCEYMAEKFDGFGSGKDRLNEAILGRLRAYAEVVTAYNRAEMEEGKHYIMGTPIVRRISGLANTFLFGVADSQGKVEETSRAYTESAPYYKDELELVEFASEAYTALGKRVGNSEKLSEHEVNAIATVLVTQFVAQFMNVCCEDKAAEDIREHTKLMDIIDGQGVKFILKTASLSLSRRLVMDGGLTGDCNITCRMCDKELVDDFFRSSPLYKVLNDDALEEMSKNDIGMDGLYLSPFANENYRGVFMPNLVTEIDMISVDSKRKNNHHFGRTSMLYSLVRSALFDIKGKGQSREFDKHAESIQSLGWKSTKPIDQFALLSPSTVFGFMNKVIPVSVLAIPRNRKLSAAVSAVYERRSISGKANIYAVNAAIQLMSKNMKGLVLLANHGEEVNEIVKLATEISKNCLQHHSALVGNMDSATTEVCRAIARCAAAYFGSQKFDRADGRFVNDEWWSSMTLFNNKILLSAAKELDKSDHLFNIAIQMSSQIDTKSEGFKRFQAASSCILDFEQPESAMISMQLQGLAMQAASFPVEHFIVCRDFLKALANFVQNNGIGAKEFTRRSQTSIMNFLKTVDEPGAEHLRRAAMEMNSGKMSKESIVKLIVQAGKFHAGNKPFSVSGAISAIPSAI